MSTQPSKLLLFFEDSFWKNQATSRLGFLFSDEEIPTWWTQYPLDVPLLTGWLAGPTATQLKEKSEEEMLQKALASLSSIFKTPTEQLYRKLRGFYTTNWITDPYCQGGYAYETVNGAVFRQLLQKPVENTLFFAGEALHQGPEIGTVEGALCSGKETAGEVMAHF